MLSGPTSGLVGAPVTWTATDTNQGATPVYQFSVASNGGPSQVVRDFSTSNSFVWDPMQEGNYQIQVIVKDSYSASNSTGDSTSMSYTADSRVGGTGAVISPTSNPLVALYSAPPTTDSSASSMYVQYSPDGTNWLSTSPQLIVPGQSTNFLVAGLLPNTTYFMRQVLDDGATSDPLTFTTGSLPTSLKFPTFTVKQGPTSATDLTQDMVYHVGMNTSSGVVDLTATDLAGNIDWYYDPLANSFAGYGPTLLPGGTVLMMGGNTIGGAGGADTLREIDLAGDPLRETNINAVNAQLAAMGDDPIFNFSHDAIRLSNGDTAVLAGTQRVINVNGTPTTYNADDIIVLDQNFQVAWVWDALDWLDPTRLPTNGEGPSDFTHANSVSYSPADGNLVVSLRAQDWVLKINYDNGAGDGHIVWTLGAGGNFTLTNNPSDTSQWFSHQHDVEYINDNTLVVFDDGNTRHLSDPNAHSRGQEWVLNEQTMTATLLVNADLGNYSAALGSAQVLPNGNLDFTSGILGAPPFYGQSIEVSPNGSVNYVLQQNSGLEYRSYLMSTLYNGQNFDYGLLDSGFENPNLGTGVSVYNPAALPWSFSGTAGVASNGSDLTSDNPNAPEGSQVAFLQGTGTIGQVANFLAGGYTLSFQAAQSANNPSSSQSIEVLVDGSVVGTFTPSDTNYALYTTNAFTVTAGTHTVQFVGLDPDGGGNIAFLNDVSLDALNQFNDPGFATPNVGTGASAYAYNPTGAPWTYSDHSGVAGNGSAFTAGNPNAPQGTQVAFIQQTGTLSQSVLFTAGTYAISFEAAQRANYQASSQTIAVEVDGTVVGTFTPSGTGYALYTTNVFTVTAGTHTVEFLGLNPNGGDNTAFLDNAGIAVATPPPPSPPPSPNAFSDPSFAIPNVGTGLSAYAYNPDGAPWTYSDHSGVAGNGSAFTAGNPSAPVGTQVAFIQTTGTLSQTVTFTADTYTISFDAAQRGNNQASSQTIEVLVDGSMVGIVTPNSTSYVSYTTNAFTVTAGTHTVQFVGLNPNGGDNTAFLDNASIATATSPPPSPPPSSNAFSDPSFATPNVGTGFSAYQYNPAGAPWTYSTHSGVAGNGSAFTSGNPSAPQGSQVAFIQTTGTISQTVTFTDSTFTISFEAAQRANNQASSQTFAVEVDGTVVGTFTPSGTSYALYTTSVFTVTAGTHTVAFVGLDPSGGDNTAFLDDVSVDMAS